MFVRTDNPPSPATCILCGSGTKADYLDFGISIEFHGALLLCNECFKAAASVFGLFDKEHCDQLQRKFDNSGLRIIELEVQNSHLRTALDSLILAGSDNESLLGSHACNVNDDNGVPLPGNYRPEIVDQSDSSPTGIVDSGEGTIDESGDDEGMDELPTVESNSSDFRLSI
jgi:hypothetical protein